MKHAIGSYGWFAGEGTYSRSGTVETVLEMLLDEQISLRKAVELIQYATDIHHRMSNPVPQAPWPKMQE